MMGTIKAEVNEAPNHTQNPRNICFLYFSLGEDDADILWLIVALNVWP